VMVLPSHVDDGAAKATLVMGQWKCRVILATMLPSHDGDGAIEATWPRRDVDAES
jgi:hypothetical protein